MAFVGHVFVPPPQASERARRLSAELSRTIAEFQRREPGTSGRDIRQALFLASRGAGEARPAVVALTAGALALTLGLGVALSARGARGGQGGSSLPWGPLVVLVVLAAVALTVYLRRRE